MEYPPCSSFFSVGGFFGGKPTLGVFTKGVWGVFDRAFLFNFSSSAGEMIDFTPRLCYNALYEKVSVYFI